MIITKQIDKVHYWKMFGKIRAANFIDASHELLDLYKADKVEVCVVDFSEVRAKDISRDIFRHIDVFDHDMQIPTFFYGLNKFATFGVNLVAKMYPKSTGNFIIVNTKEEAWGLVNKLLNRDSKQS